MYRPTPVRPAVWLVLLVTLVALAPGACGGGGGVKAAGAAEKLVHVVEIEGGRVLYVRCAGSGSPTVVMGAGDLVAGSYYVNAEWAVSQKTRTCVYDHVKLGRSDPAPGARQLPDLVGNLKEHLDAAEISGPYLLVGASGVGYIIAGYAEEHPDEVAGMVLVDTPAPWLIVDPPQEIVKHADPDNPENPEHRDYLQVAKDVWKVRRRIGNFPVRVISADYPGTYIKEEPLPKTRKDMRHNVEGQKGWLVLSPRAKQIVIHSGHNVLEEEPEVVIEAILKVVREARAKQE